MMRKTLSCFATAMIACMMMSAYGQTVTGRVTTVSDGSPLPGVSVLLKGSNVGTSSNSAGEYAIQVKDEDAILAFSFIGFITQEVSVAGRSVIDVSLKEDISQLEEVVVTAMGYEREKAGLGYAVTKIKGEDLTKAGVSMNPAVALYGRAAGVQVNQGAAGPTGGINIRVRGAASLNTTANVRPLFIVDGVIIYDEATSMESRGYDPLNSFDFGSGINDLNPADIESIEILSGAQATALYGSKGANGVVLITSKKGKNTRGLGIQLAYQTTIEDPVSYIDFQNQYGSGENQYDYDSTEVDGQMVRSIVPTRFNFGPKFDGSPIRFFDGSTIAYKARPNNYMKLFRTGSSQNLSVAIAGNSEFGNMRLAFSRDDYHGIMDNFDRTRNTVSINGQIKASNFATFEVNSSINSIKTHNRLPNIQQLVAWGVNRDYPTALLKDYYKDDTGYRRDVSDSGLPTYVTQLFNVLWEQNDNSDTDQRTHLIGAIKSTLNFTQWLSLSSFAGLDYTDTDYITKNKVTRIVPVVSGGSYEFGRRNDQVQTYNSFLNFNKSFSQRRLNVFAFAGGQFQRYAQNTINVGTYGDFMFPDWYSLSNESTWPSASEKGKVRSHTRGSNVLYSMMGSATVSWDEVYYLELSGRNDWDSTLPPDHNSFFYPGASFTWRFNDMIEIPKMQFGKLRLSWAQVGRGTSRYFTYRSYNVSTIANTNAISVQNPADLYLGDLGEDYRPERKQEVEVGFDTRFFAQNRLEVDFSFYTNRVYNQITAVPISAVSGGSRIRINAGEARNWGYELMLKGTPVVNNDFRWDVTLTASRQRSEVTKIYPGIDKITLGGSSGGYLVVAKEGRPYGDIQMFDYQKTEGGSRIVDSQGFYQLQDKELTTAGNINPKMFGGIFSDVFYKGLNFHVGLDYKFGGTIFSFANYYLTGNGATKNTLKYRDEAHGGLAYYIDDATGQKVAWQHDDAAPVESRDGLVYHDGLVLAGKRAADGGDDTYVDNDIIISATDYYASFIHDLSTGFQPDNLYKNDYVKVRELAISYTLPAAWVKQAKIQKLTVALIARNLFYLYKSIPNIDAESALGPQSYYEYSFLPSVRSYGISVNASF